MQKLVFFIEPDEDWGSPSTVGNLYINRFAIDEDAGHEIVNIRTIFEMSHKYWTYEKGRRPQTDELWKEQKGTDQIIFTVNSHDRFVKCFCYVKLTL